VPQTQYAFQAWSQLVTLCREKHGYHRKVRLTYIHLLQIDNYTHTIPDNCRQFYNCETDKQLETCPEGTPFFHIRTLECQADSSSLVCYPTSSKAELNPPTEPTTTEVETELTTTEQETQPTTEEVTTTTTTPINTCQPNLGYTDPLPHPSNVPKITFRICLSIF